MMDHFLKTWMAATTISQPERLLTQNHVGVTCYSSTCPFSWFSRVSVHCACFFHTGFKFVASYHANTSAENTLQAIIEHLTNIWLNYTFLASFKCIEANFMCKLYCWKIMYFHELTFFQIRPDDICKDPIGSLQVNSPTDICVYFIVTILMS